MKSKGFIIFITIVLVAICTYHLSFTWKSNQLQQAASLHAEQSPAADKRALAQHYLDSLQNVPVYNLLGKEFTLQQVDEKKLGLGLDLKGGLHMVLEPNKKELLQYFAANSKDEFFKNALDQAAKQAITEEKSLPALLLDIYQQNDQEDQFKALFYNHLNQEVLSGTTPEQIVNHLEKQMDDALKISLEIIRNRIDRFGVSQASVSVLPSSQQIQVEIPGIDNPERIKELLKGTAKLQFNELYELNEIYPLLQRIDQYYQLRHQVQVPQEQTDSAASDENLEQLLEQTNANGAPQGLLAANLETGDLSYPLTDTAHINSILAFATDQKVLVPKDMLFRWAFKPHVNDQGVSEINLYFLKNSYSRNQLEGDVIVKASQEFEEGEPSVSLSMNAEGSRKWRHLTAENVGHRIAIVIDNGVYSAPVVQSEIPNGQSTISGNFTVEEAKDLANVLQTGKLPSTTNVVEEGYVGPTLGQETVQRGLVSILAGLGLVATFMMLYYRMGGAIANIALLLNIFFIFGVLAQFHAALTLPGLAGIALTIGMAVDANVLIFERIREELKNGMRLVKAVSTGYQKALSAILDSNITTFLMGFMLYNFGTGGIKGFALVLMIGIATSLFTSLYITRLIIDWGINKGWNWKFESFFSWPKMSGMKLNFVGARKWAYLFSTVIILLGMAAILLKGGLEMGVDFKGGRSYVVAFDQPVSSTSIQQHLKPYFEGQSTEVKTYGNDNTLKITTSYLIDKDDDQADNTVKGQLLLGLNEFQDQHPQILSTSKVGATIADDLRDTAKTTVLTSLLIIFLYMVIRFRHWGFGVGALIALVHDVLMVFAWYGFMLWAGAGFEIDQIFIAAILTVIGYSINDTVVVFDRIREQSGEKQSSSEEVINLAINKTLSRTIITSLTVFIVALILMIFGTEVLRGFAFAILIGVIFGTYSSIFIATPVVVDLRKISSFSKKPPVAIKNQSTRAKVSMGNR